MGRVYQKNSIPYCLGWGTVHGEPGTENSHGVPLPSTPPAPPPAVGAPTTLEPLPLLWQIGAHPRG